VPAGGDAYILSNVVSDMADAEAIVTLKNCRTAMGNEAKLLLINNVMPAGGGGSAAAMDEHKYWQTVLTDLIMLTAIGGGRVCTEAEFRALLEAAGFRLTASMPTSSSVNVLEAVPAS